MPNHQPRQQVVFSVADLITYIGSNTVMAECYGVWYFVDIHVCCMSLEYYVKLYGQEHGAE